MGYANTSQLGTGLRQRLYSRAFIIGSPDSPAERIMYLVLDTQSGDTAIRHGILEGLASLGEQYSMYKSSNIAVTGTHSHSGPGAWLNYLLPQITSRGFSRQSYDAIVSGALLSIRRAHESLVPGELSFGSTDVVDANVNRSPYAYLANPEDERARYADDVDKTMTMLYLRRSSDGKKSIGVLTWFPVHGTSMLGNNTLVTGDNKGVAAHLLEQSLRRSPDLVSEAFVAGFSQSNVGDTSPNVLGAYCEDGSDEKCSFERSLCGGRNEPCYARGPFFGLNDAGTKSCFEIGRRQFTAARSLFDEVRSSAPMSRISGPIRSLHVFKDFSSFAFEHPNGSTVRTCPAALGYSFAAGTTDGHGEFDFKQNSSGKGDANPVWAAVGGLVHIPSQEQIACQAPKPILLDVGASMRPYQWSPNITDIQLLRVGQLIIVVSPGEATTMSGRRWKAAIATAAKDINLLESSKEEPFVVLGAPANSYTHYIATEEEYNVQRYEGASTLYGPHTLNAYISITTELLPHLSSAMPAPGLEAGPQPPIHTNSSLSFIRPVVFDSAGLFHSFGEVLNDVDGQEAHVYRSGDIVKATFVGANPRNNLRLGGTFAAVQKIEGAPEAGIPIADDADWEVVYEWRRTNSVTATSEVTISWEIPDGTAEGQYQLVYNGDSKAIGSGKITSFQGRSRLFRVSR